MMNGSRRAIATTALFVAIPALLVGGIVPVVYSYVLARSLPPPHER